MTPQDPLREMIREVAEKHGVALSREDPILIMQTVNAHLLEESRAAQRALLNEFKSELEEAASRWDTEAKDIAQRILNAALTASKDSMLELMQAGARENTTGLRREIEAAHAELKKPVATANRVAQINLLASMLSITAVTLLAIIYFFR